MIEYTTGNLLNADVEALVNTVNCVGIMGKGIALQFKQAFPDMFRVYRSDSKAGLVTTGHMHVYPTGALVNPKFIINFPTKNHWRGRSKLVYIEEGLTDLIAQVRVLNIASIAIPPLGSGNGGLDWNDVKPRIEQAFVDLPNVRVLLFEPFGAPSPRERRLPPSKPSLTTARALFLKLLDLYTIPDYRLTLLEVQKLAYFLQAAGQPLKLDFRRHIYGPYAHNLNHVLRRLEGHFLHGAVDVKPETPISLADGASEAATAALEHERDASARLQRVAQLIEGFETPYGMELLATVHWVATEQGLTSPEDIELCIAKVRQWSTRKHSLMTPHHIRTAHDVLCEQGWFNQTT